MSFTNEPVLELRRASVRDGLTGALAALDAELPLTVPVLIGGEPRTGGATFASTDPGAPDRVVAHAHGATAGDVDDAVAAAVAALPAWSARSAAERGAVLERAAGLLRADRERLAALAVRECAKPWREADADVAEAIDFLRYYADQAAALERGPELVTVPGERNVLRWRPRGVTAIVAPWNFPLAIPLGMTAAALAVGGTAVLKPAEQAPACAYAVVDALLRAGLPPGAISLLPGAEEPGRALVAHPDVATIAFTGSEAVGVEIMRAAAEPGRRQLKHVVAELGGKNCVIVDADADLDEAVPGVLASAFAFAGQKCSAASRVLVHERIADAFARRVAGALATLEVGQADAFATDVPPVIEAASVARLVAASRGARVLATSAAPAGPGHWFAPTVLTDLPDGSELRTRELFGPLLTLEPVRDVEAACALVDALPSALTGGLYCRNPATVDRVAAVSPVGNLYVNREITGAMVGRHPFGGNRRSGTGSKAGGPDYLRHFAAPHVLVENTMRHGLVV